MRNALLPLLLSACDASSDARRGWLVEQLVRDNAVWMSRDPALLEGKYAVMAADPYDFMRGTAAVFLADQGRPGTDRPATSFLTDVDAGGVLLVGDPHPENFGTFPTADGGLRVDVNDLDGAAHGPWIWDLRRAALGLGMGLASVGGCTGDCFVLPIAAIAEGYAEEITSQSAGVAPVDTSERGAFGVAVEGLIASRARAVAEDVVRRTYAPDSLFGRKMAKQATLDDAGRGELRLTADEARQVDRLLASWDRRPVGFRKLEAVRRFGVGVASRPAVRFGVLYDLGDDGSADDRLLQLREVVDAPSVPGVLRPSPGVFADQVDRVEQASRELWFDQANDPLYAGIADGVVTFKVMSWTDAQSSFTHEELVAAMRDGADLAGLGRLMGRVLASAHARSARLDGEVGLEVLASELDGRAPELADELVQAAADDVARTLADHARFVDALDELGPWLGADAVFARGGAP